eukprot:7094241-Alexandrium_andersonii.AAC.1
MSRHPSHLVPCPEEMTPHPPTLALRALSDSPGCSFQSPARMVLALSPLEAARSRAQHATRERSQCPAEGER